MNSKLMAELSTLYTQPHRKYHNINHINDCLVELHSVHNLLNFREYLIVERAIWYHDAVYNPYSKTNEADSAALIEYGGNFDYAAAQETQEVVLATASHLTTHENLSLVTQVMLDIDLSGFGKNRMIYAQNSMNIRHEYYNTSIVDFIEGRGKFLVTIAKRPTLYYTEYFYNKYHKISQENLKWELEAIDKSLKNGGLEDISYWGSVMEYASGEYYEDRRRPNNGDIYL